MSQGTPPPQEPYGQPPAPGYPAPAQPRGVFGALFDISFEHFATRGVVKIFYILSMVFLGLVWLGYVVAGFSVNGGLGILALLGGGVAVFLYLCFIRLALELFLAVNRMSEDIHHRLPRS